MSEYIQIAYDKRHGAFIDELTRKFSECSIKGEHKIVPAGSDEQDGLWWRWYPTDQEQIEDIERLVTFISKNQHGNHVAYWKDLQL